MLKPFQNTPTHIPDDQTMESGLVSSRKYISWAPLALSGNTTVHCGGLIMAPHPQYALASLLETSSESKSFTDVSSNSGTAGWYDPFAGVNPVGIMNVSNILALCPSFTAARVRCVGMGIRVTYEGSELNRAGRYFAGLCPVSNATSGYGSGIAGSLLSTVCASPAPIASLKGCMTNLASSRVADGTFEYCWQPNGAPTYQAVNNLGSTSGLPATTVASGSTIAQSAFNSAPGSAGIQAGQNVLVFWVEGDTVSAAQSFGNIYSIEMVYHWEIIPNALLSVAYQLSASRYVPSELAAALNLRQSGGSVHETTVIGTKAVNEGVVPRTDWAQLARTVANAVVTANSTIKTASRGRVDLPRMAAAAIAAAASRRRPRKHLSRGD